MTNSSVNQVLVTKGNQTLAAANTMVTDLLPGQLGFFDSDTRLAIHNAATANAANRIVIAVGTDNGEIRYQAGPHLQKKNFIHASFTPASAARPQIFKILGIKADCDKSYVLKMEFMGPSLMETHAHNRVMKNYSVKTSCCTDCASGCNTGSCSELVNLLVKALNADTEGLFIAGYLDDTGADIANEAAFLTWVADPANADKCPGIKITTVPQAIATYCGFNFNYDKVRDILVRPYLTDTFVCSGTVTETQAAAHETGVALDVAYMEQICFGYKNNNSAYRILEPGIQKQYQSLVDMTKRYDQFWLQYFYKIESGAGRNHENSLQTLIATPEGDTVTRNAIAALMALIFPNLDSLVDDTAAASATANVVEAAITSELTDGIV